VSGALFLCVGVVYDRLHTREIARYGGLVHNMPRYALIFMIFTFATIGLPATSGFVGEFLILVGAFQSNNWVATLATTGVILGAAYSLYLYRRIIFGTLVKEDLKGLLDVGPREIAVFAPLIIITMWMGIYPSSFLDPMSASVGQLVHNCHVALDEAATASKLAQR
jgi:NADH-quinone oxidoreductase subunit M